MTTLPDWWPTHIPPEDANGHELAPGKVSEHWVRCDCEGAFGGGHHITRCRINGCREEFWPLEHSGPKRSQR